jgi:hypothetical protein
VWYLCNGIDKPFFAKLLAAFARQTRAGRDRIIVLQLDNAGWQGPQNLPVPDGIRLVYSRRTAPNYSPPSASGPSSTNRSSTSTSKPSMTLMPLFAQRYCILLDTPDVIKSHTKFHRWPKPRQPI